jgi:hypothetical protein
VKLGKDKRLKSTLETAAIPHKPSYKVASKNKHPKTNMLEHPDWLMVLTILKNISQWEGLSPIVYGKINSCSKPPTS